PLREQARREVERSPRPSLYRLPAFDLVFVHRSEYSAG
ncbi:MAG: hypothetical protein ACI9PP_002079, partial [Halobacteriales archaeon]